MERRQRSGKISLIVGPMFSGKTIAKQRVIVVKYSRDNRYDDVMLCTHDLRKMDAISAIRISDVYNQLLDFDVIGIDEGQFFEDIYEASESLAKMGKLVIVASLDSDYKREPFINITNLLAKAEKIQKLTAVCNTCGDSASFTLRTVRSSKREIIGGSEMYQAACRNCHYVKNKLITDFEFKEKSEIIMHGQTLIATSPTVF